MIEEFGQWCPFCLETGDADYGPDGKRWNIILVDHRDGEYENHYNVGLCCDTCNKQRHPARVEWCVPLGFVREEGLDWIQATAHKWPDHPRQNDVVDGRQNDVAEGVKNDPAEGVKNDPAQGCQNDPLPSLTSTS